MQVILKYQVTVVGTTFPERSMIMDSEDAAKLAVAGLLAGPASYFAANGGKMVIHYEVNP